MDASSFDESRNVIPRWRSPSILRTWEIAPSRTNAGLDAVSANDFDDQLALWRNDGTLSASIEIYDTGVFLSDNDLIFEGAGPILRSSDIVPDRLIEAVRRSVAQHHGPVNRTATISRMEANRSYIVSTIRRLKKRLVDFPTDTFARIEIARLYVLLGQDKKAEPHIHTALSLDGNSRVILRAATQYFHIVGDVDGVLPYLRKSEAAPHDALIQSAEIAASDLAGRSSKFAGRAARDLRGQRQVTKARSELALAVATLEMEAGTAQRRVFQMVQAALPTGTENAMAQAVWLGERTDRSLYVRYPDVSFSDDAFEAKALTLTDQERYSEAVKEAHLWLADQPFSPDAVVMLCTTYSIYLRTPSKALQIAERGRSLHQKDWGVQNSALLVYALSGHIDRAEECSHSLDKLATTPSTRAFYHAGRGLIAYAKKDVDAARRSYANAKDEATKAKRKDLFFSASVFMILGEARMGYVDLTQLPIIREKISEAIKYLPFENRDYCLKLWRTIEPQITDCVIHGTYADQNIISNDASMNHVLDELEKSFIDRL